MMTPSHRMRRPISPPTDSWTTRSPPSMVGGRTPAELLHARPRAARTPDATRRTDADGVPFARPARNAACRPGLQCQGGVPRCRLLPVGRPLRPACAPVRRSAHRRRPTAAPAAAPDRERSDVRRRAPRLSLPASMAAARRRPGPDHHRPGGTVAQGDRGPPRRAASSPTRRGARRSATPATRSRCPRPTWPTSTGSPRSSWATAPARSTPTTSAADRRRAAGPTTPARRSTRRRRWRPSTPTASTRSTSAAATPPAPTSGGYQAIAPNGGDQWFVQETNPGTDPGPTPRVPASLTVGAYAGGYGVEAGLARPEHLRARRGNGAMLGGFPWFSADSVFSTAAVADLYADGNNEIISGGDSSAGFAYGQTYANGGHIRILSSAGNAGTGNPAGGPHLPVQHEPEHRPLVAGRRPVPRRRRRRHRHRRRELLRRAPRTPTRSSPSTRAAAWPGATTLNGVTADSPALADVQGNGQLDVVEGTQARTVYVLNGTNGAPVWSARDQRAGHRLAGDGRPDRRRLPGRHRPDDATASTSSTAARAPRWRPSAPTTASRARRW